MKKFISLFLVVLVIVLMFVLTSCGDYSYSEVPVASASGSSFEVVDKGMFSINSGEHIYYVVYYDTATKVMYQLLYRYDAGVEVEMLYEKDGVTPRLYKQK